MSQQIALLRDFFDPEQPADDQPAPGLTPKGLASQDLAPQGPSRAGAPQPALPEHPALWRAGQLRPAGLAISTGYPELDQVLAGGWPADGLNELLLDSDGIGELQLLMPAMRTLSQSQQRWIVWINPPYRPCAPALAELGIDLDKILMIYPRNASEALWSLEKVLRSGGSSMALAWIDESALTIRNSRRLQLAARQGHCCCTLFRPGSAAEQSSMARLRLALTASGPETVQVDVRKRQGAWPVSGLQIRLDHAPGRQSARATRIRRQLEDWRRLDVQYPGAAAPQSARRSARRATTGANLNSQRQRPARQASVVH
ncbi:MAG: translesion DNA synthesis-associated protein ImuA [Pseudomonadota bacterium]